MQIGKKCGLLYLDCLFIFFKRRGLHLRLKFNFIFLPLDVNIYYVLRSHESYEEVLYVCVTFVH